MRQILNIRLPSIKVLTIINIQLTNLKISQSIYMTIIHKNKNLSHYIKNPSSFINKLASYKY